MKPARVFQAVAAFLVLILIAGLMLPRVNTDRYRGRIQAALEAALGRIKARMFIMPLSTDMFFPVQDCAAEQALIPNSELRVVNTICGHFGLFGIEPEYHEQVDGILKELLASAA